MKLVILALGLLAILTGMLVYPRPLRVEQPPPPPIVVTSQGPTIERLERLSQILASRVYVADVLVGESNSCRGCWLVRGDSLISVDLRKAAIIEKDEATKRATIRLPQPEVIQARVDHTRTRVWQTQSTSWIPWRADCSASLLDEVMHQAQLMVAQAAASKDNIEQAKRAAEIILAALYEHVEWNVRVTWQEPPTAQGATDAKAPASEPCPR